MATQKGKMIKSDEGRWVVSTILEDGTTKQLNLHPHTKKYIADLMLMFDYIDVRIASSPYVNFEVQTITTGTSEVDFIEEDVALVLF